MSAVAATAAMVGTTETRPGGSRKLSIPPPVHPTYDLQQLIRLALAEDAGDRGKLLSKNDVGGGQSRCSLSTYCLVAPQSSKP